MEPQVIIDQLEQARDELIADAEGLRHDIAIRVRNAATQLTKMLLDGDVSVGQARMALQVERDILLAEAVTAGAEQAAKLRGLAVRLVGVVLSATMV